MRIDAECVSTAAMEDRASEFLRRNAGPVVVDCAEALCAVARVSPRERFSPFSGTIFRDLKKSEPERRDPMGLWPFGFGSSGLSFIYSWARM